MFFQLSTFLILFFQKPDPELILYGTETLVPGGYKASEIRDTNHQYGKRSCIVCTVAICPCLVSSTFYFDPVLGSSAS
jgi:hypothetical protein